ncbi:MAG: FG-GAP repeat protein, partial [Thermoleophilia bacterium]|nr:FG-GAP repeat protein [Thermoleophilia bacterium]
IDGPHTVALAGWSVAGAGDVNGDGRDDVVVGASSASNNSRNSSGSAYVLFGSASPVDVDLAALGSAGMRIDGAAASDGAGRSVAGAGDLNGDGRADVILGADHADDYGRTSSGSVYVAYGFGDPAVTYGALSGTVGAPVTTLAPTGVARTGPASFAVSPALPAGLSMDPATGVISGTPTLVVAGSTHTVTMTDLAGSVTASVQIDVVAAPTAPAPPAEPTPAAPAPASPRPDTRAPRAKVRVPASLPAGPRVRVRVRCDERCRVVVRAGTGRPTRVVLRRGVWRWVAVSLPHRSRAARRGGVVRVRLVVSDAAGNRTVQTRTLRTRRAARH